MGGLLAELFHNIEELGQVGEITGEVERHGAGTGAEQMSETCNAMTTCYDIVMRGSKTPQGIALRPTVPDVHMDMMKKLGWGWWDDDGEDIYGPDDGEPV